MVCNVAAFFGMSLLLFPSALAHSNDQVNAQVEGGTFQSPSARLRPRFRYFLPDASVDKEIVQADIKSADSVGAGGLEFLGFYNYGGQAGGIPAGADWSTYGWGTPAWQEMLRTGLEAHKEAGLVMDWPLGPNQGQGVPAEPNDEGLQWDLSPFTTAIPANGSFDGVIPGWGTGQFIALVSAEVLSSKDFTLPPDPLSNESASNYSQLIVMNGSLRDISRQSLNVQSNVTGTIFDNGSYIVDHYSARGAQVITNFWEENILTNGVKDLLMEVGVYGWEDSIEARSNISWTPSLPSTFAKKYGYDIRPYLPLIMFGNGNPGLQSSSPGKFEVLLDTPDQGAGYVEDYRGTLVVLYRQYLEALTTWANSYLNLQISAQVSYNLPMDMQANVPFVNAPECESLGFRNVVDGYRQFSGPADLTRKRVISNELGANIFKDYRYLSSEMVWSVNRAIAGGVNFFVLHGQAYSGNYYATTWPGYTPFIYLFSETWSNKQPAWYHGMAEVMEYIARIQYIHQIGVPRLDVVFYNKVPVSNGPFSTAYNTTELIKYGYSYTYLSPDNFALPQAFVRDGVFAPEGPASKALVVPNTNNVTLDAVLQMQKYAQEGLPVILSGGDPGYYPSKDGSGRNSVKSALASLKATKNVYSVASGQLVNKLLSLGVAPHIKVQSNGTWRSTWREEPKESVDYAFLFCDGGASNGQIEIATSKTPYFFNLWTGERTAVFNYQQSHGETIIPLSLAANETVVIAFSTTPLRDVDSSPCHAIQVPPNVIGYMYSKEKGMELQVVGPANQGSLKLSTGRRYEDLLKLNTSSAFLLSNWTLTAEHWEAPTNFSDASVIAIKRNTTHQLPALISWTEIPPLANASGVGYYTSTITWPPESGQADGAYLKFPTVRHAMRVYVNGKRLPPVNFDAPEADIGSCLKTGKNEVVVEVPTVMWNFVRNLLSKIQDAGSAPIPEVGGVFPAPEAVENGLIGSVEVIPYQTVTVTCYGP